MSNPRQIAFLALRDVHRRGVFADIALDKWELREGDDPIIFMESMVNDPTITRIADKQLT